MAEFRRPFQYLVALYGHQSRDYGYILEDTRLMVPQHLLKLYVCVLVVE